MLAFMPFFEVETAWAGTRVRPGSACPNQCPEHSHISSVPHFCRIDPGVNFQMANLLGYRILGILSFEASFHFCQQAKNGPAFAGPFYSFLLPIYKTLPSVRRTISPSNHPNQLVIHSVFVYYLFVLYKYLCRNGRTGENLGVLRPFFGSKRGLQSCNFCLLAQNFRKNMHLDFKMVKLLGFGI